MTHTRNLSLALAALVAGVVVAFAVPAVTPVGAAAPETASFTAVDFAWEVTGSGGDHSTTIAMGGTVTFAYPSGGYQHNADFSAASPTSCTQEAGPSSGPVPPLPAVPTAAGWSGRCRFDTPGRYTFHCDLHGYMQGTVEVVDPNAPPPPPGGTTTAPPTGTNPGGTRPAPGGSPSRPALSRVSVAVRQRGVVLRGSVTTPAADWRIVVKALVSNRALAERPPRRSRKVRVGSRRMRSTAAGRTPFAVRLNADAREALARIGRLAVTLQIVVTPPSGRAVTKTVAVVVRPARAAAARAF